MRKIITGLSAVALIAALSACSKKEEAAPEAAATETAAADASAAPAADASAAPSAEASDGDHHTLDEHK